MTRQGATSGPAGLPQGAAAASLHGFGPLRHVAETGSTNTDLVEEARAGDRSPCVLVADHQTAGRGRLGRVWDDRAGDALLVSVRAATGADAAHALVASVAAGARAAVAALVAVTVGVKWPNDLVVSDGPRPGKLAGILAELVDGEDPAVVVGLGCNLEPVAAHPDATSLRECGADVDRDELLAAILAEVAARRGSPERVHDEIRRHSATLGTRVRVEAVGRPPFRGRAVELRPDGRLVVVDGGGAEHVVGTGDVVSLRPDG